MPKNTVKLHPTVKAAGWVSFLTDFSSEIIYPLLPLFLTTVLKASFSFVGVIEGAAETTASLLKLFSGWLSDRLGRRRPLVVAGYTLSSLARPLVAAATAGWQVLAIRVSDRIGKGLRTAPRDALMADVTPPEARGRAFGFQRAMDHAGAVAGPLLAFFLLRAGWQYRALFALAAIPGALAVLTVLLFLREPSRKKAAGPEKEPGDRGIGGGERESAAPSRNGPAAAGRRGGERAPFSFSEWKSLDRRLLRVLGIIALFTLGNSSDAFLLLRAQGLGVPPVLLPILWVALHAVKSLTSTPGGILSDRLGRRRLIVAGWTVYALVYAGFALARAQWQAWALFLVYGLYFGLTEGVERALVSDLAEPAQRGAAFGLYAFLVGVTAFPASALFGLLWDRVGVQAAFLFGAALALLSSVLLALGRTEKRSQRENRDPR